MKVTECNFRNYSIANIKIYKCLPHIAVLAFTVSKIYTFFIFYHQNVGQGHGVNFRNYTVQWQMQKSTNVAQRFLR